MKIRTVITVAFDDDDLNQIAMRDPANPVRRLRKKLNPTTEIEIVQAVCKFNGVRPELIKLSMDELNEVETGKAHLIERHALSVAKAAVRKVEASLAAASS